MSSIYSSVIDTTITISKFEILPSITNIVQNRKSRCINGRFTVNATGSGPLEYALVRSLDASEIPGNIIRPKQTSNVFDSLASGDHFLRVYNACGTAITQRVSVESLPLTTSIYTSFNMLGCDSARIFVSLYNYQNLLNTIDTSNNKLFIEYTSGRIDTINSTQLSASSDNAHFTYYIPMNKIDEGFSNVDGLLNRFSQFPQQIKFNFNNECETASIPVTHNLRDTNFIITPTVTNECDSLVFYLSLSRLGSYVEFNYLDDIYVSLDSGATWNNAAYYSTFLYSASISKTYKVPNKSIKVLMRACGDTASVVINEEIKTLNAYIFQDQYSTCENENSFYFYISNSVSDSIRILIKDKPSTYIGDTNIVLPRNPYSYNYYSDDFINIPTGAYRAVVYDTFNTVCKSERDFLFNIYNYGESSLSFSQECDGSIAVKKTNSSNSYYAYYVIKDSTDSIKHGPTRLTLNTNFTIGASIINTLDKGQYNIEVYKDTFYYSIKNLGVLNCPVSYSFEKSATSLLNLSPSSFIKGCDDTLGIIVAEASSGKVPYTYSLVGVGGTLIPSVSGSNMYANLPVGITYTLQVVDSCGNIASRTFTIPNNYKINIALSQMPCLGDTFNLNTIKLFNGTYQWYKNNVPILGATNHILNVIDYSYADSGYYKCIVNVDDCIIVSDSLYLNPTSCGSSLPLGLYDFDGQIFTNYNYLNWSILKHQAGQFLELERSTDGLIWNTIFMANVSKKNSINDKYYYEFKDQTRRIGNNFYRIKMGNEEKWVYSNVIHLKK